ncbi:P8 family protein [Companilactobacillus sp. DQM5]|uniref:P8 family protein n=1 Tax=Companilactobacillus sp. DQM5 TaxID=3463359 RepID=UPI00405A2872
MTDVEKTLTLDKKMNEVFSWSDDTTPVRDALWNHFMDDNNKDTMKTMDEMKKFENMDDSEVASAAEKLLKK